MSNKIQRNTTKDRTTNFSLLICFHNSFSFPCNVSYTLSFLLHFLSSSTPIYFPLTVLGITRINILLSFSGVLYLLIFATCRKIKTISRRAPENIFMHPKIHAEYLFLVLCKIQANMDGDQTKS